MARRSPGEASGQRYSRAEQDAQARKALELRTVGLSDNAIAAEVGISVKTVSRRVKQALAALSLEEVETYRSMEEVRLDFIQRGVARIFTDDTENTDNRLKAAALLIKLSESKRKLLGIDVPAQVVTYSEMQSYVNAD